MSTNIDQKSYLQKYLGGSSGDKKKKKKKVVKGKGFKIIDDDIDLTKLRPLDGDELDILDGGEDAPQVAGIIDERPEEVKKLEQFNTSSKWRVVTQDDGFNSNLQIEEIKRDIKEVQKENEVVFGKMYSDSEDEKKNDDSDLSPPRIKPNEKTNNRDSKKKQQNNSDSDFSPPRKSKRSPPRITNSKNHDSEVSHPRTKNKNGTSKSDLKRKYNKSDSDQSPPRKGRATSSKISKTKDNSYDSDLSPPRKTGSHKPMERRKPSRWGDRDDSEISKSESQGRRENTSEQFRKSRKDSMSSESDESSSRKLSKDQRGSKGNKRKESPIKRNKSPAPRKKYDTSKKDGRYKESREPKTQERDKRRKERRQSSDSDLSPPRKNRKKSESPLRKSRKQSPDRRRKRGSDSDSDLSPPRKERNKSVPEKDRSYKRNEDSPPPTNKKMERTLEGKMAGLQDARQLREENEAFKRREDIAFSKMTDDVSGRNAQVVSRKSKRETSEERQKLKEKAERQKELDEKYKNWSKGLKQIEAQEARLQDFMHEASKPLARHRDDRDLENSLKQIEREGDPMLQYMREKKRERGELGPEKPMYKGNFPPNRFNIRPGYRWDGVDRSNGYERKFFEHQSKRKAQEEEAYKWSTEDL